jgi:hypothetical protein
MTSQSRRLVTLFSPMLGASHRRLCRPIRLVWCGEAEAPQDAAARRCACAAALRTSYHYVSRALGFVDYMNGAHTIALLCKWPTRLS